MKFSKDELKRLIFEEMNVVAEQAGPDQEVVEQQEKMMLDLKQVVDKFEKALKPWLREMQKQGHAPERSLNKANAALNLINTAMQYQQQIEPLTMQIQQMQQMQTQQLMGAQGMPYEMPIAEAKNENL